MHSKLRTWAVIALLAGAASAQAQPPAGPQPAAPRLGNRATAQPVDNDLYRSTTVSLGGGARDGMLYESKKPSPNSRVAVLYSNRNFGFNAPAVELASLGYRVLYVTYPELSAGQIQTPYDGFLEISRGIAYLRGLPGVERVVMEGWGAGTTTIVLYADVAANGAAACQPKEAIYPCRAQEVANLAKPDGVILYDPGLGAGTKAINVDPAFDGAVRSRSELDRFAVANGYDTATGTAAYSDAFRKRYYAAQSAMTDKAVADGLARLKALGASGDEPFSAPGVANLPAIASLHYSDLRLLSHTKRPHIFLKADGSRVQAPLRSIRPATGPKGEEAIRATITRNGQPSRVGYSLREFLANDAIRTTKDFAITEDDVIGVDWKSANGAAAGHAGGVKVPALIMTNTCFQFVVPSEITFDRLGAADKTLAGVEGSEHEFTPCQPQYGDTKKRLFSFVSEWLAKPGRF